MLCLFLLLFGRPRFFFVVAAAEVLVRLLVTLHERLHERLRERLRERLFKREICPGDQAGGLRRT